MKKFLLLSLALVVSNVLFAQLPKGLVVVGGSSNLGLSFTSTQMKDDDDSADVSKESNITFAPMVGYTIMDNLALGLVVNIESGKTTYEDGMSEVEEETSSKFVAGPFARYYFPTGGVYPFVQGAVLFGSMKETYDDAEGKSGLMRYGVALGIDVPVSPKSFLDVTVGYDSTSIKPDGAENGFKIVNSGIGVNVGFILVVGK